MVFFRSPRTPFLHPCGCLTHQNRHTHPQRHSNIHIFVWALNSDLSGSLRERLKHSKKTRTMALKPPAETPTKNLPRDTPQNPKNDPWTGPPRDPGRPHPGFGVGPSGSRGGRSRGRFSGFWGVSLGGFLWAFRPGVLVPLFGFFLSVSAVEVQHPKLSPRQLNVPCAAST